MTNSR
jgi:hypothetical protein